MKRPEKQFWTYIVMISSVLLLGLSGQLVSCARAETVVPSRETHQGGMHPVARPDAPWNTGEPTVDGPMVQSSPGVHVEAQLDRQSVMQHSSGIVRVEVRIDTALDNPSSLRTKSDIVVVVDTSGSMEGEKLYFAKQALFELFERLDSADRFALVEYSSNASTLIPLQHVTPAAKTSFQRIVSNLVASGSTNMSAGLDRGSDMLRSSTGAAGRLVLLSDGLANAGDSSAAGLTARARHLSQRGFALSTMGIGQDFDEHLMTSLATSGTGAFYYLAKLDYLPEFLEAELASGRETYGVAANLHIQPASGITLVDAMGLDTRRDGDEQLVRIGNLYAGRNRSIWLTLRAPTHRLGPMDLGSIHLTYDRAGYRQNVSVGPLPTIVCLDDREEFERRVRKDVWERALLNNVFSKAEEDFGDAIRSGDRQVIREALSAAEQERNLAESLGSQNVISKLDDLKGQAASAVAAQAAPAAERNEAAKKAKARGYQQRNRDMYKSPSRVMEAY